MAKIKAPSYPHSMKLYEKVHRFLNDNAPKNPSNDNTLSNEHGKGFSFEEIMNGINYKFNQIDKRGDVYLEKPDGSKDYAPQAVHNLSVRFSEVINDIDYRLKKHGYKWSVKIGRKKGSTYFYRQYIPFDFINECEYDKTIHDLNLLKDVIGYTQTPLSNKAVKRDIISFSTSDLLGNVDLVKELFLAIRDRKVVEFTYNAAYSNHPKRHVLSPHYLKEYNLRWFLFGHTEEVTDLDNPDINVDPKPREGYYTFAVDRIDDEGIKVREDLPYHDSDTIKDYSAWFDEIVGVTHKTGHEEEPVDVDITTFDPYTHNRILVKPFHKSQVEISPATKETPGHIRLHLCVTQELESQLLSFGDSIVAKWEGKSYDNFFNRVNRMHDRYNK